jgi:2-keto-4-pentenoate hydratase
MALRERESVQASIAKAFVEARKTGAIIADYPGSIPAALDEAYQIQDTAIALTGKSIGGWKVGRIAAPLIDTYGSDRIAGPIFSDQIVHVFGPAVPDMPVLPGFAAIEAELLLRVGAKPPPGLTVEDARHYVDQIHFGLEVASSPFPGINDYGPAVTISDFGNNFGLVLGPRIKDWQTRELSNALVQLSIDGELVGEARLEAMLDGPFGAFCFLANSLTKRGLALEPGQWVSTGAITGIHPIAPGQCAEASFDSAFRVSCRCIAYSRTADANGGVND